MKYTLTYSKPNAQYIPITAIVNTKGKKQIELCLSAWRPGRYELGNFAKNIHGFSVFNDKGKKLKFEKTSKDVWLIENVKTSFIEVRYSYFAAELNAGSTFMNDQQLYVNPVNCLVYVKDQLNDPCELHVKIPADFKLACGALHKKNIIRTENFHELADSPFIAGASLQHHKYKTKDVLVHLWFQGECKPEWDKILPDFIKFTNSQIEKFGKFPVPEYHFLFQILPYPNYHGVEHLNSTVLALGPGYELMKEGYDDLLGVCSHELYHAWNIKSIRPVEMFPYDYSKENYSRLGYVCEGVTTYMGDLFLAESGVRKFSWYKTELEKLLQRHFDNFGRFNYSVAESSFDTWLDGYVSGAPNRKTSIYNEGALLAFVVDMKIRKASANKNSLHDVMQELYQKFALKRKGYSEEDYKKLLEKYTNEKLDDLFDHFIHGVHSFETILVPAFETVGLSIKMIPNPSHAQAILGVKTLVVGDKTVVKQIYPGSTADLGKIQMEDEIVAVNGYRVNANLDKWVEYFKDSQIELTVSRAGRILQLLCPHTNKSYFPVYQLSFSKAPSNLEKRIFKKWCGEEWGKTVQ
ncbi:MAG: M61 family metallopeptidase [Crocinitomicaceae bacterium]|nr:M61 family metallopeptidase [Crocinitomicaceae bacterium]